MQVNITNSSDDLNNSKASEDISEKQETKKYIEVVPSRPTYHLEDIEVTRVLKYFFDPETNKCDKMAIEYTMGFCHIIDYSYDCQDFSTSNLYPNTMPQLPAFDLLLACDVDIDFAIQQLEKWGIDQVYLHPDTSRFASVRNYFEGIKEALEAGTMPDIKVICMDGKMIEGDVDRGYFSFNYQSEKQKP